MPSPCGYQAESVNHETLNKGKVGEVPLKDSGRPTQWPSHLQAIIGSGEGAVVTHDCAISLSLATMVAQAGQSR